MNLKNRKILIDSIFISLGDLFIRLKGIIFIPIILYSVGIANYGVFVQILVNISIVISFCHLELGLGFYRYTSKYEDNEIKRQSKDYWSIFISVLIFSIFGGIFIFLLSPLISRYILSNSSVNSLKLSSSLIIVESLNYINLKFIQSRKKFRLFSFYNIIYEFIPYSAFIVGILMKSSILFGLKLYLINKAILMLSLNFYIVKMIKFAAPSLRIFKKFFKYSFPLVFSTFSQGLLSKVDRYFIGFFLGPAGIGTYNIIYSVCNLLYIFCVPFTKYFSTYLPVIWDEGNKDKVKAELKEGLLYFLIASTVGLIGITFLLKPTIKLILQNKFLEFVRFEWVVLFIGLGIISYGVTKFFFHLIKYREQTYIQMIYQMISAALNIILNFFLIREYGILGAAVSTFISYFVIILICNFSLNLGLNLKFLGNIFRIGVASIPIIFWLFISSNKSLFNIVLNMFIGVVIYITFILLLRIISIKDVKMKFTGFAPGKADTYRSLT